MARRSSTARFATPQESPDWASRLQYFKTVQAEVLKLELFQDCGCPKQRACACYVFNTGCQKCDNCLKNKAFFQETGQKGDRPCKLVTPTDNVKITKYRIEFPRTILHLKPSQQAYMHSARMIFYTRQLVRFAIKQLVQERAKQEALISARCTVAMQGEDPLEQYFAPGSHVGCIDTDLAHGTQQRVRADLLYGYVFPALNEAYRSMFRVNDISRTIRAHLRVLAGAHVVRVARGFLGRCKATDKRKQLLRHFAALRIQSLWRGFWDRTRILPDMWDALRQRSIVRIQRQWRRFVGLRTFRQRTKARAWRNKIKKIIKIQKVWRGYSVRRKLPSMRAGALAEKQKQELDRRNKLTAARARREAIKHAAAVQIQRVFRGMLGRRHAYARRHAKSVSHPRLAALADSFLSSGDLWGFLTAVNNELQKAEGKERGPGKGVTAGVSLAPAPGRGGSRSGGARPPSAAARAAVLEHVDDPAVRAAWKVAKDQQAKMGSSGKGLLPIAEGKEGGAGTGDAEREGTASLSTSGGARVPRSHLPGRLPSAVMYGQGDAKYVRGREVDPYAPISGLVGGMKAVPQGEGAAAASPRPMVALASARSSGSSSAMRGTATAPGPSTSSSPAPHHPHQQGHLPTGLQESTHTVGGQLTATLPTGLHVQAPAVLPSEEEAAREATLHYGDYRPSLVQQGVERAEHRAEKHAKEAAAAQKASGPFAAQPRRLAAAAGGTSSSIAITNPEDVLHHPPDGSHPLDSLLDKQSMRAVEDTLALRRRTAIEEQKAKEVEKKAAGFSALVAEHRRLGEDPLGEMDRQTAKKTRRTLEELQGKTVSRGPSLELEEAPRGAVEEQQSEGDSVSVPPAPAVDLPLGMDWAGQAKPFNEFVPAKAQPAVDARTVTPAGQHQYPSFQEPSGRKAAPFVIPLIEEHELMSMGMVEVPTATLTPEDVRRDLATSLDDLVAIVSRKTLTTLVLQENKVGYGKWSRPGDAGVRNALRRERRRSLSDRLEADRKAWRRTRRGSAGDASAIEETMKEEETYAAIDPVALGRPPSRYISSREARQAAKGKGRPSSGASAHLSARPTGSGHAHIGFRIAMGRSAEIAIDPSALSSGSLPGLAAGSSGSVSSLLGGGAAGGAGEPAPRRLTAAQRAVLIRYKQQALAAEAAQEARRARGELDALLNASKGYGADSVLQGEGGAEGAMVDVAAMRKKALEAEQRAKEETARASDPYYGMSAEEAKALQQEIIAQKLAKAEEAGLAGWEQPFDDGWRSTDERADALAKRAQYLALTAEFELDRARAVSAALVDALVSTVSDRLRHVQVVKRNEVRGATAPSVLVDGPARMRAYRLEFEQSAAEALQPDLYRAVGRTDVADRAVRAVTAQVVSEGGEEPILSPMEALQAQHDPALKRAVSRGAASQGGTRQAKPGPAVSGQGQGQAGGDYTAGMDTGPALQSDDSAYSSRRAETAGSLRVHNMRTGSPAGRQASTTTGASMAMDGAQGGEWAQETERAGTASDGEEYVPPPSVQDTAAAYGFDRLLPGSSPRPDQRFVPGSSLAGPVLQGHGGPGASISDAGGLSQPTGLGYGVDPNAVFSEEAHLRAHGLGVLAVRTLLVDVRGLEGPIEPLLLHALLRCLPVPRPVAEQALAQGHCTAAEYLMLLRVTYAEQCASPGGEESEEGRDTLAAIYEAAEEAAGVVSRPAIETATQEEEEAKGGRGRDGKGAKRGRGGGRGKGSFGRASRYDAQGRRVLAGSKKDLALSSVAVLAALPPLDRASAGEVAARLAKDLPGSLPVIAWKQGLQAASAPYCSALRARGARTVAELAQSLVQEGSVLGLGSGPTAAMSDAAFSAVVKRLLAVLLAAHRLTVPAQVKALYHMGRGPAAILQPVLAQSKAGGRGENSSTAAGMGSPSAAGARERARAALTAQGARVVAAASAKAAKAEAEEQQLLTSTSGPDAALPSPSAPSRLSCLFVWPDLFTPFAQDGVHVAARRLEVAAVKPSDRMILPPSFTVLSPSEGIPAPSALAEQIIVKEEEEKRDAILASGEAKVRAVDRKRIKDDLTNGPGKQWLLRARRNAIDRRMADGEYEDSPEQAIGEVEQAEAADFGFAPPAPPDAGEQGAAGPGAAASGHTAAHLKQQKELTDMLMGSSNPFRRTREQRVADITAVITRRQGILMRALRHNMYGLQAVESLESPLLTLLVHAAFFLPLPSPKLAYMAKTRRAILEGVLPPRMNADERAQCLVPHDVFLRHVAITKPLSDVLTSGLKSTPGQGGGQQDVPPDVQAELPADAAVLEPLDAAHMGQVVDRALTELMGRSKGKLLVHERAQAASMVARPWAEALAKWGYTRLYHIYRTPARELEYVLTTILAEDEKRASKARADAAAAAPDPNGTSPQKPAMGPPVSETDERAMEKACKELTSAIPPYGIGLLLESCMAAWMHLHPWAEVEMQRRAQSFDARYARGPMHATRTAKAISALEAKLETGIAHFKEGVFAGLDASLGVSVPYPPQGPIPGHTQPGLSETFVKRPGQGTTGNLPTLVTPQPSVVDEHAQRSASRQGQGRSATPSTRGQDPLSQRLHALSRGSLSSLPHPATLSMLDLEQEEWGGQVGEEGQQQSGRLLPSTMTYGGAPDGRTALPPNALGRRDPAYKPRTPFRTLRDAKAGKVTREDQVTKGARSINSDLPKLAPPPRTPGAKERPPPVYTSPHGGLVFLPPNQPPVLPSAYVPTHSLQH